MLENAPVAGRFFRNLLDRFDVMSTLFDEKKSLSGLASDTVLLMATIHISDELYLQIQQQCAQLGCTEESLAEGALQARLQDYTQPHVQLTPDQMDRMRESVAQLARGETVSSDEVDKKFERFFQKLAARREAA